ncbi:MAG: M20/M25/M40 family metallo-hydrolase, partial [Acidimicrobiia bacterium]
MNPPGQEAAAQEYVAQVLEGVPVDLQKFEKVSGRPNLVASLPGRGERPHLVLHGHVDVVGFEGQDWDHPPLDAVVEDGVLHGRGALDMKSGVAMMCHAFARAVADGLRPGGDVILAIVSDSETGGSAGLAYLLEEHGDLFDGAGYAVGEFGGFPLNLFGRKFYRIGVSQKQYAHLRLRLKGRSGHGSSLATDTVVGQLGRVLAELDRMRFPYRETPVVERIIDAIAAAVPEKDQTLRSLLNADQFDGALADLGTEGHIFESLVRDTANPTIVSAGAKFNVIPSEATIELDARLLPGGELDELLDEIRSKLEGDTVMEILDTGPGGPHDFDDTLFPTL